MMFIRMNLAVAKKTTVVGSPRYKVNWDLRDRASVEALYREVVGLLNGGTSLGLFSAYKLIFGEEAALSMAKKYKFPSLAQ
jgi:hypothetical protein